MKKVILSLCVLLTLLTMQSCDYATSNVQTLITDDCGVSWRVVKAGQSIPKRIGTCQYKVTLPDYPMQGESTFRTPFKGKVLANCEVTYDYSIVDPVLYIGEAKYLGKSNTSSDDETNSSVAYETAENGVIDKRIKEIARGLLIEQDIVEFSQAEFEELLLIKVNELLKTKGVQLNSLSFVPIPEEQTRLAIDVATAWRIYQSKNLDSVGAGVLKARAGASRIIINADREKTSGDEK